MKGLKIPIINSREVRSLLQFSVLGVQILQLLSRKVRFLWTKYKAGELQSRTSLFLLVLISFVLPIEIPLTLKNLFQKTALVCVCLLVCLRYVCVCFFLHQPERPCIGPKQPVNLSLVTPGLGNSCSMSRVGYQGYC